MSLASVRTRLAHQLDALDRLLGGASHAELHRRDASGAKWSAHENLAHVARHQHVMLERVRRMLEEDVPVFGRYRAEDDPEWPAWTALETREVVARLRDGRRSLLALVDGLAKGQQGRKGRHPLFGEMDLAAWLEFLQLHEAHHLYLAATRVGQARSGA